MAAQTSVITECAATLRAALDPGQHFGIFSSFSVKWVCFAQTPSTHFFRKMRLRACLDPSSVMYVSTPLASRPCGGTEKNKQKNRTSARTECGLLSEPLDKTIFFPYIKGAKTIFYCEGSDVPDRFSSKEGCGVPDRSLRVRKSFLFYVPYYTTKGTVRQVRTQAYLSGSILAAVFVHFSWTLSA